MTEEEKPREGLAIRLWRKRWTILLWGVPLLACDLVWHRAWSYATTPPYPPWAGLILPAGLLPLIGWFFLFFLAGKDDYRAQIAAGKINPPEVAEAIYAVKLRPKKKKRRFNDLSDWFDPEKLGQPDPGYGRGISWAPKPLQGPLFFLCCLLLFLFPVIGELFMENFQERASEGLSGNLLGLLASFFIGGFAAFGVVKRRHKRIWAEIRASQQQPPPS
jgi:hypothetical protein